VVNHGDLIAERLHHVHADALLVGDEEADLHGRDVP
jgi:hypothetical protein